MDELRKRLKDPDLLKNQLFVGGQWVDAASGETVDVLNPATQEVLAKVPKAGASETRAAIAEADSVFPKWKSQPAKQRADILKKWYQLVVDNVDDIAIIMSAESGKPVKESKVEATGGAGSIEWFAEEAKRIYGDIIPPPSADKKFVVIKDPVGVVYAVTPWNFPMSMITRKASPAIAAGCPVILKPAESTPLTAFALAELARRAGVPSGVLNVLTGDSKVITETIMKSDVVRKIGFTGSTAVGKILMKQAADTVKKVSLELGGNAPFIVFDDADVELAAKGVVASAFRNAGQTCICANRTFVQAGIYDQFSKAVVQEVNKFKLGDGLVDGTTLGPLISPAAVERVAGHVDDAVKKGAKPLTGGKRPEMQGDLAKGNFYEPTILGDATIDMKIFSEETFGPAVPLFKFDTEDEAVKLANNTEYGLAAYYYTTDLARTWRVAEALEYGMIGCNETLITDAAAPFGGIKESGLGREQSKYGISEFLEVKFICMGVGYSGPR
jgi:succinate-semialdehyde dehydrogenase/glutarate-semialdehyde dehydrogenase